MTLEELSTRLESGDCKATELVQESLSRCDESTAASVFTEIYAEAAFQQARNIDSMRAAGRAPSRWAGIPVTVKDLFDLEGHVTRAGSKALADKPAASKTAPAIQRLIDAGFVILGKVNMTEFAYSGLGLNPHYGTPVNPWSGEQELIPGGSSSGGAVSVALNIVAATIGTDTGGSVRIPSSLCHLTGFKPASTAVIADGVVPLAHSLDSIGPLTNSVACCTVLHQIMAGQDATQVAAFAGKPLAGLRFLVPDHSILWRDTDTEIVSRCDDALQQLVAAGVEIVGADTLFFDQVLESGVQGVLAGYESAQWHRELMISQRELYDPRVISRLDNGARIEEPLYKDALKLRNEFKQIFGEVMNSFDAVVWPATARCAPAFSELESDEKYSRVNLDLLRNTSVGNVLDAAAISLPLPAGQATPGATDKLPVGLMLHDCGENADELLKVAASVEKVLGVYN